VAIGVGRERALRCNKLRKKHKTLKTSFRKKEKKIKKPFANVNKKRYPLFSYPDGCHANVMSTLHLFIWCEH